MIFCIPERGYPDLHLAIIYDNGSVWDFSMKAEIPIVQDKLLQLPKSHGYYGFSDDNGVLYLMSIFDNIPITKYHKKENHRVIPKSKRMKCAKEWSCSKSAYIHGILLRTGFFTFARTMLIMILLDISHCTMVKFISGRYQ